jgi:hypothetical protein
MSDLDRALADISAMRRQMTQATLFRGYGPAALAATGGVAMLGAAMQATWVPAPLQEFASYVVLWTLVAIAAIAIIAIEAVRRSTQEHGGLADDMLKAAAEQFLPAALAGVLLTAVIGSKVPDAIWMLPGLWQIVLSLGVAAACTSLPRPMIAVSLWYLCCGLACLTYASGTLALSPWAMGLPFGIGQVMAAVLLKHCFGGDNGEPA